MQPIPRCPTYSSLIKYKCQSILITIKKEESKLRITIVERRLPHSTKLSSYFPPAPISNGKKYLFSLCIIRLHLLFCLSHYFMFTLLPSRLPCRCLEAWGSWSGAHKWLNFCFLCEWNQLINKTLDSLNLYGLIMLSPRTSRPRMCNKMVECEDKIRFSNGICSVS